MCGSYFAFLWDHHALSTQLIGFSKINSGRILVHRAQPTQFVQILLSLIPIIVLGLAAEVDLHLGRPRNFPTSPGEVFAWLFTRSGCSGEELFLRFGDDHIWFKGKLGLLILDFDGSRAIIEYILHDLIKIFSRLHSSLLSSHPLSMTLLHH